MLITLIRVTIAIISRLLHGTMSTYRISFLKIFFNIFITSVYVYLFNFYHTILAVTIASADSHRHPANL